MKVLKALSIVLLSAACAHAEDWPQWMGTQRDGVWHETGILQKFPAAGPTVRWRVPVGGGYSGPAVANGRVYVTDRELPAGTSNPADPFKRDEIPGKERVLCLNEADGRVLWTHAYDCKYTISYPAGPRTTPVVSIGSDDTVYTLGAEGTLLCLDAKKGTVVWSKDFNKDYATKTPLWGYSSSPLIDGQKVICIVGGAGSTVVAFDKDTGKELWKALSSTDIGYSSPVIYEAGGKRQLITWDSAGVHSLDPETGTVYWTEAYESKMAMVIATPRKLDDKLLVTSFFSGPVMMKLDAAKPAETVLWRGKSKVETNPDKLHCCLSTPFLEDGYIYGVCAYGQLRCLKADTGEQLWETLDATGGKADRWANAFIIKNGDRFFLPNEKGDLIIAKLSPKGYEEISRAHLLEPTGIANGRPVVWSHPAFANKCIYARNDKEIVCVSLAEK
jgi:outer membrane protein assembly factor BamB